MGAFVDWWLYCLATIFGIAMGSFLNVLISRIHNDEAWWKGRSKCPHCKKELTAMELLPIFSFILQKGRCRGCGKKISYQYILVEILSGILALAAVYLFGFNFTSLIIFLSLWLLLGDFISDLLFMEFPEVFNIGLIILGILYQIFYSKSDVIYVSLGVFFGLIFFGLQYLLTKGKGLGEGDIRIGVIIGLFLSWPYALYSIFISYVAATIIILPLLLMKKKEMKSAIPLGVFLIPVLMFAILFPNEFKSITPEMTTILRNPSLFLNLFYVGFFVMPQDIHQFYLQVSYS